MIILKTVLCNTVLCNDFVELKTNVNEDFEAILTYKCRNIGRNYDQHKKV